MAPSGMGSQNCTSRHSSTDDRAGPAGAPKVTSSDGRAVSTTPRPPGVMGIAASTPVTP